MKILVSDPLSREGIEILTEKFQVDEKVNLAEDELTAIIGDYDALVVRSGTKVTAPVIDAGKNLKVIGRAGVGVDNIDVTRATEKGVIVLNAPEGNTVSAAEHAVAMMMALSRNIPGASNSLKNREWKRSQFMGVELYNKTLGVVGLGRVGSEVIRRAKAMGMRVQGYDPYISVERADKLGVKLVSLEEIYRTSDFITLHLPKTGATYHMIGEKEIAMMKEGVRIVNCARGGLIEEKAFLKALQSKKIAGAALDVFEKEPAADNPLVGLDNVVATPHLGASTREAQVNVAIQVAHQVVAALMGEPVVTAVNVPAIPPETMADVKPFIPLMNTLGKFYMQVFNGQVESIELSYCGEIAAYPVAPLTTSCLIGLLSVMLHGESVNYVNAPHIAKQRGIKIKEITTSHCENFTNLVSLKVKTNQGTKVIGGTVFNKNDVRIVQIDQYRIDVVPSPYMLVCTHFDQPGVIGRVGSALGQAGVNIAGMQVGRITVGGEAVMILQVDHVVGEDLLKHLSTLESILSANFVQL